MASLSLDTDRGRRDEGGEKRWREKETDWCSKQQGGINSTRLEKMLIYMVPLDCWETLRHTQQECKSFHNEGCRSFRYVAIHSMSLTADYLFLTMQRRWSITMHCTTMSLNVRVICVISSKPRLKSLQTNTIKSNLTICLVRNGLNILRITTVQLGNRAHAVALLLHHQCSSMI